MTPRPGLLRGSKIKNYKGSNALRVTWSPPPGFSTDYAEMLDKFRIPREFSPILCKVLEKVFAEYNTFKAESKSRLLKRKVEIGNLIEKAQIRFGVGDISEDVYNATINKLRGQEAENKALLDEASENLSNQQKFINKVIATTSKLGDLGTSRKAGA